MIRNGVPDQHKLSVYVPTKLIRYRGDTLGGPVLTITFSSPMADVIKVKLTHVAAQQPRQPHFAPFPDEAPPGFS